MILRDRMVINVIYLELRDTQNKLYLYNVDNLEGALFALSEVRKMFVRYMQN